YCVLRTRPARAKSECMGAMKAAGVDYEDRIAGLETLEHPKPNREFIYETFNAFADRHPWVGAENIRAKSVAREMYETLATFGEYVRELGLERSEGVLLRYLADVYRTLEQTVPPAFRDDEVDGIALHLRAMLRETDSSVLDEWERMRRPERAAVRRAAAASDPDAGRLRPLRDDAKALLGHVRGELHRLVKLLAGRRYEEAAAAVRDPDGAWTAAR